MAESGPPRLAADFVKAGANKAEVLKTLWPEVGLGHSNQTWLSCFVGNFRLSFLLPCCGQVLLVIFQYPAVVK